MRDSPICFQGDEIGNTLHIDLAKVQMFFFTLLLAAAYLAKVFEALHHADTVLKTLAPSGNPAEIAAVPQTLAQSTEPDQVAATLNALPEVSASIVYALGISHAGYLGSKAMDHTPVQK